MVRCSIIIPLHLAHLREHRNHTPAAPQRLQSAQPPTYTRSSKQKTAAKELPSNSTKNTQEQKDLLALCLVENAANGPQGTVAKYYAVGTGYNTGWRCILKVLNAKALAVLVLENKIDSEIVRSTLIHSQRQSARPP